MRVRVRVRVRVRGRVRVRVRSRFHRRISPPEPSARLPTAEHRGRRRPSWRRCAGDDSWAKPAHARVWCQSAVAVAVLLY